MHSVWTQNKTLCRVVDLVTQILASLLAPLMFAGLHNQSQQCSLRRTEAHTEHLFDHFTSRKKIYYFQVYNTNLENLNCQKLNYFSFPANYCQFSSYNHQTLTEAQSCRPQKWKFICLLLFNYYGKVRVFIAGMNSNIFTNARSLRLH